MRGFDFARLNVRAALCLAFAMCLAFAIGTMSASPALSQTAAGLFAPRDNATITAATDKAIHEPLDVLTQDVEHLHPVAMLFLAKRLSDAGRGDDAVFWFYEGQLRWKAHLALDKDQMEEAMFERLFSDIGPDINKHAFRDLPMLQKTVDAVLDWDASHPDAFTPPGQEKDDTRKVSPISRRISPPTTTRS